MSRVLKFRAWLKPRWEDDEEANKMYYDIQNSYDTLGNVKPYDIMNSFDQWLDNDVAIVEQYTGSTDKNGKEIYEGDILDTPGGRCLCVWSDGTWAYQFKVHRTDWFDIVKEFHKKSEVIGNIHENKELWNGSV